jgi:hypothetical protein
VTSGKWQVASPVLLLLPLLLFFWLSFRAQRVNLLSPAFCAAQNIWAGSEKSALCWSLTFVTTLAKNGRQQVHSLRSE